MKTEHFKKGSRCLHLQNIRIRCAIAFCILFGIPHGANSQSFTTWQAGPSSDWYANYVWTGGTNFSCDCLAGDDVFRIIPPGNPSNPYLTTTRPHQAGSWSGTSQIALGSQISLTVAPQMSISNGSFNQEPFGNCSIPCGGAYGAGNLTITTEALRAPQNITYMYNPNGSVTFSWNVTTDIPEAYYALFINHNMSSVAYFTNKSVVSYTIPCPETGEYEFYTEDLLNFIQSQHIFVNLPAAPSPTGKIQGSVTTLVGNAPVSGVTVTAVLQNPGQVNNSGCYPLSYSAVSDAQGDYVIPFIYWGVSPDMANFEVTPTLTNHSFMPAMTTTTLKAGDYIKTINFKDTTSFVISGTIDDINNCGLDSVLITATPGPVVPVYTQADGTYNLVVPQAGTFTVTAQYNSVTIGMESIMVNANTGGHDFTYTETDTLHGFVGAGCYEYIGQATLEIQTEAGCILQTVQTNPSGYFEVELPSRKIQVQVIDYDPGNSGLDMLTVLNAIDSIYEIDLDHTTTLDIFYRKPISMEFFGIPADACPAINHPVLYQAQPYGIIIKVWESQDICPADTGYISIQNNVSTNSTQSTILDTIPVSNGIAYYTVVPGEPELASPYVKTISFTAHVDNQITSHTVSAIVSGSRQRTATFTTGGPTSLPFLILRDPPGDLSKSFFNQDTTRSYSESYSTLTSGGVKVWAKAKVGVEIFSLKAWGEIQGAISVGGSAQTTEESLVQMSSSLSVETSSDEDVVGPGGDLIMGAAVNFIYGLADVRKFDLNSCTIVKDTVLVFSPDTFATTFILTVDDIRNITIPALELLANNPDTTEEARAKFRNEISVWEQTLQLNEDLKAEALENPIDNYTLSASAGPVTLSTTGLATTTKSLEFKQYIEGFIAAEAGLEIGGSGGSAGVEVTIRGDFGQSAVESTTIATTTGFTFDDNDNGDDLVSFDYAKDKVYGTPVFSEPLGQTSCPHETGTQFIDLPSITCANPVKNVPSGNSVEFTLTLGNNSESDDERTYVLDFNEQSNEFGALIFNGANPFSGTIPFTISAGATTNTTIRVERTPGSANYTFEGLQFDFYPECEPSQKRSVFLTAYFANTCSSITMASPGSNWLINDAMEDAMDITMTGYVLGGIDTIKLIYSPAGSQSWKSSNIVIPGPNILAPPQTYSWDVSDIPDGLYNIRLALVCGETINYSTRKQGRIDRTPPVVFGIEEPKDDLYHPGDKISVTFKEDINCTMVTPGNCYLRTLPQNEMYAAQYICNGKTVTVIPDDDLTGLYNQPFEVGLMHMEDMYQNQRPDTVAWQFVISEPDSDQDGVPDTQDRCPGGNDYVDTDLDGLPDDCDCMPTVPANGRLLTKAAMDFDGTDDHIVIPSDPDFDPGTTVSFTFEAWVKPQSGTVSQTILSRGTGINGMTSYIFALYQNKIALYIGGGGGLATWIYGNTDVPFNTWMHAAVTYDHLTQVFTFYLNGEYDGESTIPHGFYADTAPLYIGRQGEICNCNYYKGRMDEVRIWNTARTPAEIIDNMHHELEGDESGLIAYYQFNEGTPFGNNADLSTVSDGTGNGHTGTLSGFGLSGISSNWAASPTEKLDIGYDLCVNCPDTVNAAMHFDGVDDKIVVANDPALIPTSATSMTIEAWVYPTVEYPDVLISSADNVYLALSGTGHVQIFTQSYQQSVAVIPQDIWTHLAFAFYPTGVKLYINGVLESDFTMTHNAVNIGNPVSFGGIVTNNDYLFNGKMDDIRFWDSALTEEQILAHIQQEVSGTESGLVAYYNFNQGIPAGDNAGLSIVADATGNGHDGTPVGFAQTGFTSNWVGSPFNFPDGDKDGLPDLCDACFAVKKLTLENQLLDQSIYRAEEQIILGPGLTFPNPPMLEFRAPVVKSTSNFAFNSGSITIIPVPCDD